MARVASRYVCQSCGAVSAAWEGRCHVCGTWESFVETVAPAASRSTRGRLSAAGIGGESPRPLREVAARPAPRLSVGIAEVDRVLGGGLVPGALVLLGGEPGIGKSTLVLEIAAGVARCVPTGHATGGDGGTDVLYASGEESADQLHLRADRLGLTSGVAGARIQVLAETALDAVLDAAERLTPGSAGGGIRSRP